MIKTSLWAFYIQKNPKFNFNKAEDTVTFTEAGLKKFFETTFDAAFDAAFDEGVRKGMQIEKEKNQKTKETPYDNIFKEMFGGLGKK